jgi:hypothetical protein
MGSRTVGSRQEQLSRRLARSRESASGKLLAAATRNPDLSIMVAGLLDR